MAYMIYQQYTTAVKEAYKDHPDVAQHLASANACRLWLSSLNIEPKILDILVEQAKILEQALLTLVLQM